MQRILAASLVPSHDFNFRVTAAARFQGERRIMLDDDDPTACRTIPADQDILLAGDNSIGERIELELHVRRSYYVDATDRTMHHLIPRVPLIGNHCRLTHLEYFGINSYAYFECLETNGTTFMFVARIDGCWLQ